MADAFTDLTPAGRKYFSELRKLEKLEVIVGFQAGEATEDNGADVASVAAFNELGTSSIPPRPFMKQSFENHGEQLQAGCDMVNNAINEGHSVEQPLNQLGVLLKGLVQTEITDGEFEPNAPSTIARKGSDHPLIDTGTMRQSVNYVVRQRTKG